MHDIKTFCVRLSNEEKIGIQQCFLDMYYNTDQDTSLYAEEYYYVTAEIMQGKLPIALKYLSKEFIDILVEKYPFLKEYYKNYTVSNDPNPSPYIECMDCGVTYTCENNIDDIIECIIEEYVRNDVCLAEFLENIAIYGVSIVNTVRIFSRLFNVIEKDSCIRHTNEGDDLDLI